MVKNSAVIAPRVQGKSASNKQAIAGALVAQLLSNMQTEVRTQAEAGDHFLDVVENFMELNKTDRELRQAYQETAMGQEIAYVQEYAKPAATQGVVYTLQAAQEPVAVQPRQVAGTQQVLMLQPNQKPVAPQQVAATQQVVMLQPIQGPAATQKVVYTLQAAPKPVAAQPQQVAAAQQVVMLQPTQKPVAPQQVAATQQVVMLQPTQGPATTQKVVYTLQAAQKPVAAQQIIYTIQATQKPVAAQPIVYTLQPVEQTAAPSAEPSAVPTPAAEQPAAPVSQDKPVAAAVEPQYFTLLPQSVAAKTTAAAWRPGFVEAISSNLSAVFERNKGSNVTYVAAPKTAQPGEAILNVDHLGLSAETPYVEALAVIEAELRKTQAKSLMLVGSMNTLRHLFEGTSNYLARAVNETLAPEEQPLAGESHMQMLMRKLATNEYESNAGVLQWLAQARMERQQQIANQPRHAAESAADVEGGELHSDEFSDASSHDDLFESVGESASELFSESSSALSGP